MDDKLRKMARQALADVGYDEVRAADLLEELHGGAWTLREYNEALDWALAHRPAADLPAGSIVASQTVVFLKDHQVPDRPWSCTDGGHAPNEEIDRYLGLNARVLRVGTGED